MHNLNMKSIEKPLTISRFTNHGYQLDTQWNDSPIWQIGSQVLIMAEVSNVIRSPNHTGIAWDWISRDSRVRTNDFAIEHHRQTNQSWMMRSSHMNHRSEIKLSRTYFENNLLAGLPITDQFIDKRVFFGACWMLSECLQNGIKSSTIVCPQVRVFQLHDWIWCIMVSWNSDIS